MVVLQEATDRVERAPFHHEAFVYDSDQHYVERLGRFIAEGLDAGDAVLVALPAARLGWLQGCFEGVVASGVRFASMEDVGRNPAWIIPVWAEFVDRAVAEGRGMRGIGEPIWPERSGDELVECERHEALLNIAFSEVAGFRLLCPYDAATLDPAVIAHAHQTHPHVSSSDGGGPSAAYDGHVPALSRAALTPVPDNALWAAFDGNSLGAVRHWAADLAAGAGLTGCRVDDLTVAVSEGMTNSVRHGGGVGNLAIWSTGDELLCEIRDAGRVSDPLAGRVAPSLHRLDGRGLWIMHRLCDLVQMRAVDDGQIVRLHFSL